MIESNLHFSNFYDDDYEILYQRIKSLLYHTKPEKINFTRENYKTEFWGNIENTEEIHPYIEEKFKFQLDLYIEKWNDAEEVMGEISNMDFPYEYTYIDTHTSIYQIELTPKIEIKNQYPHIIIFGEWEIFS